NGPSTAAASPFGAAQQHPSSFDEIFDHSALRPGWEWPQDSEPEFDERKGLLSLGSKRPVTAIDSAILAHSTWTGNYEAMALVQADKLTKMSAAGISVVGDPGRAIGLAVTQGHLKLWRRDAGSERILADTAAPSTNAVWLKVASTGGNLFRFAASEDAEHWTNVGEAQTGNKLPPWDRGIRVGLTAGGEPFARGYFREFRITSH
ncbi:MAG TPA: hypothetical protein VHH88_04205, partial [Verrucomicrobiae bacterium]|nr:hypothetical protein [Verrucomicrobiae bacterium]